MTPFTNRTICWSYFTMTAFLYITFVMFNTLHKSHMLISVWCVVSPKLPQVLFQGGGSEGASVI